MAFSSHIQDVSKKVDEKGQRFYVVKVRVLTDSTNDGPQSVLNFLGVTRNVSTYNFYGESDPGAVAKSVDVAKVGDTNLAWDVTYNYDSAPYDQGSTSTTDPSASDDSVAPESWPITLAFGCEHSEELFDVDWDLQLVEASNGQPFDPPLKIQSYSPTMTVTGYASAYSINDVSFWTGKVNSAVWKGFPIGTVLCTSVKPTSEFKPNIGYYFRVEYTFKLNKQRGDRSWIPWNPLKVLDTGTYYWKSMSDTKVTMVKDSTGADVTAPVPFNGSGQPLPQGGVPFYLEFTAYDSVDFNGIF